LNSTLDKKLSGNNEKEKTPAQVDLPGAHNRQLLKEKNANSCDDIIAYEEMLPIFHRLLIDKDTRHVNKSVAAKSCPDISVKCDIVEYL